MPSIATIALFLIGALALFTPVYVVVAFFHDMLFRKSKRWLTGHRDEERERFIREHPEIKK
jgi:hypothetical protein